MANIPTTVLVCVGRCRMLPPPTPLPPPPPPPSPNQSFSPYLIFMFCGLSVSFVFICYLLFAARRRRRQGSLENNNSDLESHDDFMMDEDHGPALHHPIWLINTVGLEKSQIESIQVFKYKKDQGLIEGTDCSVCLSEFEDDENLRLLPECSHAFHVPCIDMWLSSHKNCPLCRAPIINPTTPQIVMTTNIVSNPIEPSRTEGEDSDTIDHHVIEIENNEDVEKTCATSTGARANSDLVDRNRVQGNELVPMRRSVSMHESSVIIPNQGRTLMSQLVMPKKPNSTTKSGHKLKRPSSSSFRVCSKAMKSSSFGHSSRKASSSTIKCPYNRSY